MTSRRVIFPPADYWTQPKETTMTTPPIITTPDRAAVIVTNFDGDTDMVLGLKFELPPPLGTVDIHLGYETAAMIANDLIELLTLDDTQRAELLTRLQANGEQR